MVPAVFTPGPPPAHMSSPGRPVAPRLPPALPSPERPLSGSHAPTGQPGSRLQPGVEQPPPSSPAPPAMSVAEAPPDVVAAAVADAAEAAQLSHTAGASTVSHRATISADAPHSSASLPLETLVSKAAPAAASSADGDFVTAPAPPLAPAQQRKQQPAPFDPRAAAVPLGQASTRVQQAGVTAPASLHAPHLPARSGSFGKGSQGSDALDRRAPNPVVDTVPAVAHPAQTTAVEAEAGTRVHAPQLPQPSQSAIEQSIPAVSDGMQRDDGAAAPSAADTAGAAGDVPDTANVAAGSERQPSAALLASDGIAAPAHVSSVVGVSGAMQTNDGRHEEHDGRLAGSKHRLDPAAADGDGVIDPSLAVVERPLKRKSAAASAPATSGGTDLAAAVSILLEVRLRIACRIVLLPDLLTHCGHLRIPVHALVNPLHESNHADRCAVVVQTSSKCPKPSSQSCCLMFLTQIPGWLFTAGAQPRHHACAIQSGLARSDGSAGERHPDAARDPASERRATGGAGGGAKWRLRSRRPTLGRRVAG